MRIPQPPYPSFTLVLTRADNDLSLLSNRESRRHRHHPYSRPPQRQRRFSDGLMNTVDYRYVEEPREHVQFPKSLACIYEEDENEDVVNLDRALHANDCNTRRRRLSSLLIDLALAVRRRCKGIRVVKKLPPFEQIDLLD